MVTVDATLQADQAGTLVPLLADAARALTVSDAALLAKLELVRAAVDTLEALLGGTLGVGGTVALDAATLAALETINVLGPATDAQLRATPLPVSFAADEAGLTNVELRATPVPVSGTVSVTEPVTVDGEVALDAATLAALENTTVSATDLDIRNLASATDFVQAVDAAELSALTRTPFTVTASGLSIVVAVAAGFRLRLRRISPTFADPDADPPANPLLTMHLGAVEVMRGYSLTGRFDVLGANGDDLTITLSKSGNVSGTVFYTVEAA